MWNHGGLKVRIILGFQLECTAGTIYRPIASVYWFPFRLGYLPFRLSRRLSRAGLDAWKSAHGRRRAPSAERRLPSSKCREIFLHLGTYARPSDCPVGSHPGIAGVLKLSLFRSNFLSKVGCRCNTACRLRRLTLGVSRRWWQPQSDPSQP